MLPQELVDAIVDQIDDPSSRSLSTAALLCRSWRTRSQARQFQTCIIHSEDSLIGLRDILSHSQQIAAYVEVLYIESAEIASVVDVCANMVNITSLILQHINLVTPEEMSLGCQLVGSLPSLSALTFNDFDFRGDYDPRLLGELSVIQSLSFCQCWETGQTFRSPPNDQLNIPWQIRSLSLDDSSWQGPVDFLHRNPVSLKLVTRFTFRCTGMRFTSFPETARTLLDHMRQNLEELEIVDRRCSEGPKPTGAFNLRILSSKHLTKDPVIP